MSDRSVTHKLLVADRWCPTSSSLIGPLWGIAVVLFGGHRLKLNLNSWVFCEIRNQQLNKEYGHNVAGAAKPLSSFDLVCSKASMYAATYFFMRKHS